MKKPTVRHLLGMVYLLTIFGACLRFTYGLFYVFWNIKNTQAIITDVTFNLFKIEVITSQQNYQIHMLPTYAISIVILIYLVGNAVTYIKYTRHENRKADT